MIGAAFIVVASVGLRVTPNGNAVSSRRQVIVGGGLAVAATALPAHAKLPFDPIGAYNNFGPDTSVGAMGGGPVPPNAFKGRPNSGILLLREAFDGGLPAGGLIEWYDEHLAPDFVAVFNGGAVKLDKAAYLAVTADILKSFPDFVYTRSGPLQYADSPTMASWTAIVKGTHTGAPYSPLPGVPATAAKGVAVENDPEKVTVTFASGSKLTKISKIEVEAKEGGKGFSGPVGFYLQAGGDPSKLPKP